jgi:hypothetical protein
MANTQRKTTANSFPEKSQLENLLMSYGKS